MVEAGSRGSDDEDFSEEDEDKQMTQPQRDALLMTAVKDNNYEGVCEAIKIGADPQVEENGWNPLLWAACNGNEDIVRILIKNQAHLKYKEQEETENAADDDEEEKDNFNPVPDPSKTGRSTPMHWASYHGYHKVVWILKKEGMNPLLQDIHGNNCIHQAAANSQIKVLKCFMQFGVDLNLKNARTHTPLDLATDPETRALIQKGQKTTHCSGKKCNKSKFDFKNVQYYCENCDRFFCRLCSIRTWVFENKDGEVPERPVCRCDDCYSLIGHAERDLRGAMDTNDFMTVDRVFTEIKDANTDIDVQLFDHAAVLHLKLEKELDIKNFIGSLAHVDNYKTIRKSVKVLEKKHEDAEKLGVIIDPILIQQINECQKRLISERNLRFEMETMHVSASDDDTVKKLKGLIDEATRYSVEQAYMQQASGLCNKMGDNIDARETLQLLLDYPVREYPEPEPLDKNGKPIKAKDDKKKPKKRKKKEPAFPTPAWAGEIDAVVKKVRHISDLASRAVELNLEPHFLAQVDEQVKRFHQEVKHRKWEDEEIRLAEEAKALAKKKKKK